jgi:carboxypeptidase Taq
LTLVKYFNFPYNALLDLYEPGVTADELESIFNPLQDALIPLIDKMIRKQGPKPPEKVFSVPDQEKLHHELLKAMNYDMSRGRMDFSVHPFTTTTGPKDIRITTSLMADDFLNGLYSTMHEAGHGLYEQNLPGTWVRTLNGQACSLGIHESQSRMWENIVGRSEAFWQYFTPMLKNTFPHQMEGEDTRSLYLASNRVKRSYIRIDADEYTYNLHVILRFRIERMIVNGQAEVADLPELWKKESEKLFGIQPETLCQGVLQDIHWSLGDWGYFPTYTLGNLYSAQIWYAMEQDLGNLNDKIKNGDFRSILNWLADKVHGKGALLSPGELIREVSGEPLSSRFFIDYLTRKSNELYA